MSKAEEVYYLYQRLVIRQARLGIVDNFLINKLLEAYRFLNDKK